MNKISLILIIVGSILVVTSPIIFILTWNVSEQCSSDVVCNAEQINSPKWFIFLQPMIYLGIILIVTGAIRNYRKKI